MPNLILQPLVENAIKHGVARKSGPGHIQITARREGDKLWMEVRDDGVGLSEDGWRALHKGIGVSTTRERLLRLFGADFRFEFHRHNPGLAVVVAFPWRVDVRGGEPADDEPAAATRAGTGRGRSTPSQPWRVSTPDAGDPPPSRDTIMKKIKTLIVDDEPLARERLATLLATEPDIEIAAQCRDGEEAVMAIQDHAPDLMFLDVQMPGMNGFEVIEAVGAGAHAAGDLRHRLRPARPEGVSGPRARLHPEAVRPRALHRSTAARPQAGRTRRDRRSRAAGSWRSSRISAAISRAPTGWS